MCHPHADCLQIPFPFRTSSFLFQNSLINLSTVVLTTNLTFTHSSCNIVHANLTIISSLNQSFSKQ